MNLRQQLYKQHRLNGLSAYQAARRAGYRHATAICAHKNIEKRISFDDVLVEAGIDDARLAKTVDEGLSANKVHAVDIHVQQDADGKYKVNENSNDFIEIPDHQTRHKYLETVLKLRGKLKPENGQSDRIQVVQMTQVVVNGQPQEFDLGDSA